LRADRIRHGFRAAEDDALTRELVDRRIVIDVCPFSNLRTGAVASLDAHPLPHLHRAGVRCSLSTDDPAMFDTDLTREYDDAVQRWGIHPCDFYEAGIEGAICDEATRQWLRSIGEGFDWNALEPTGVR
jgi:aminodeoxyfutalosine deaminase